LLGAKNTRGKGRIATNLRGKKGVESQQTGGNRSHILPGEKACQEKKKTQTLSSTEKNTDRWRGEGSSSAKRGKKRDHKRKIPAGHRAAGRKPEPPRTNQKKRPDPREKNKREKIKYVEKRIPRGKEIPVSKKHTRGGKEIIRGGSL